MGGEGVTSSAREPKTEVMAAVASKVGVADVARAGVATSDTGIGWGGGGVETTTMAVSEGAWGGVEAGAEAGAGAAAEAAADSSASIRASQIV